MIDFLTEVYKDLVFIEDGSSGHFRTPGEEQLQVLRQRGVREQVVQLLKRLLGQLSLGRNQELLQETEALFDLLFMRLLHKLVRISARFLTVVANVSGHVEHEAGAEALEHLLDFLEVLHDILVFVLLGSQMVRNIRVVRVIIV